MLNRSKRLLQAASVAASAAALLLASGTAAQGDNPTIIVGGAAYRSTAESAVFEAAGIAEITAQENGYFGECTFVREPIVVEIPDDPYRGHTFNASVRLSCEKY